MESQADDSDPTVTGESDRDAQMWDVYDRAIQELHDLSESSDQGGEEETPPEIHEVIQVTETFLQWLPREHAERVDQKILIKSMASSPATMALPPAAALELREKQSLSSQSSTGANRTASYVW
jgi:hypothetical protein